MDNVKKHIEVCEELKDLYVKKNHDYGNSFSETYKEFGLTMPAIRLDDKLRRFKNLTKNEAQVKSESTRDCLIDLANYAIMTIIELDGDSENSHREAHSE